MRRLQAFWRSGRPGKLSLGCAGVLLLLLGTAGVLGVYAGLFSRMDRDRSVVDRILAMDTATLPLAEGERGVAQNAAQTINAVTLRVTRAYADREQVIVGYEIVGQQAASGQRLTNFSAISTMFVDGAGVELKRLDYNLGYAGLDGASGQVLAFAPPRSAANAKQLKLRFRADGISAMERSGERVVRDISIDSSFDVEFVVPVEQGPLPSHGTTEPVVMRWIRRIDNVLGLG